MSQSQLKALSAKAIPRALEKAERYRLLNEPWEAESIARDVLATEAEHQGALVVLILALTDQFDDDDGRVKPDAVRALLPRLATEYERAYYAGVIDERWAKAELAAGVPGHVAYEFLRTAMGHYAQAERLQPDGTEDAVLRWNACVRMIERDSKIRPKDDAIAEEFDDDVPTNARRR